MQRQRSINNVFRITLHINWWRRHWQYRSTDNNSNNKNQNKANVKTKRKTNNVAISFHLMYHFNIIVIAWLFSASLVLRVLSHCWCACAKRFVFIFASLIFFFGLLYFYFRFVFAFGCHSVTIYDLSAVYFQLTYTDSPTYTCTWTKYTILLRNCSTLYIYVIYKYSSLTLYINRHIF